MQRVIVKVPDARCFGQMHVQDVLLNNAIQKTNKSNKMLSVNLVSMDFSTTNL